MRSLAASILVLLLAAPFPCRAAVFAADPGAPANNEGTPKKPPLPPVDFTLNLVGSGGKPAAAVVTILDSRGVPALPQGEAHVNGMLTLQLPRGAYSFVASGGPRIMPVSKLVEVAPGSATATLTLSDYAPVWPAGWKLFCPYFDPLLAASDTPGQPAYAALESMRLASRCRGLDVLGAANLAALQNAAGTPYALAPDGLAELSVDLNPAGRNGMLVLAAWSVQRPGAGSIVALEPEPAWQPEERVPASALFPALAGIRDRGGLSVFCAPAGFPGSGRSAEEIIFDTVTGPLYDLIDISRRGDDLRLWWTLLNLGYRLPACGGGGRSLTPEPEVRLPQLGMYLLLPRKNPTPHQALEVLQSGQSVVSTGPFIRFFVQRPEAAARAEPVKQEGEWITEQVCPIGSSTYPSAYKRQIWLDAYACSDPADSLRRIELVYNGEIIRHQDFSRGQKTARAHWSDVVLDRSGWLLARYYSHAGHLWAITNPVYITDSSSPPPLPAAAACTIEVRSKSDGKPLKARLTATNFGTPIGRWETGNEPLVLQLPATAELRAEAEGYTPAGAGVYADSGARAYAAGLSRENRLPEALFEKATYEEMRTRLAKTRLVIELTPAR